MPDADKLSFKQTLENVRLLPQTTNLRAMQSIIRNKNTPCHEFAHYANRINRLLLEEAINLLPFNEENVITPVNAVYKGVKLQQNICGVSVLRAGESMETELRLIYPGIPIGKILIQRDKKSKLPRLFYTSLPDNIADSYVLLLEPMLATGGSASEAINVLNTHGVSKNKIILVTVISTHEGIETILRNANEIKIVTAAIDDGLNDEAYILPGIGDFGDRYFST